MTHHRYQFTVILLFSLCGCAAPSSLTEDASARASHAPATAQVCCESFGYGERMAKCCERYTWTSAAACVVPDGFAGGSMQIVGAGKCPPRK